MSETINKMESRANEAGFKLGVDILKDGSFISFIPALGKDRIEIDILFEVDSAETTNEILNKLDRTCCLAKEHIIKERSK
jgi:hypothetical protein